MKEISVDVGYGFVKAAAEDGYKGTQLITFPSAVLADHSSGDLGQFFGNKHMRRRLTTIRDGMEERSLIGKAALAGGGRRYWNASAGGAGGL